MRQRRAQGGFTLIELMVVVAIVGIVSTVLFSVSSRTYGANSRNVSDQLVGVISSARMRAIATRRIHRVIIQPNDVQTWASETTGLVDDGDVTQGDLFVSRESITKGVSIWDVSATVYSTAGTYTPTQNTTLAYEIRFKPDGTSSGGTLFVSDNSGKVSAKYRVLVYRVTGCVYARKTW
jgi:prepilin-type N-terminal cleavage/methylation domain-containing protein